MQAEAPVTLILSALRAGRGELERTRLAALFGDPNTVPAAKGLSPFGKRYLFGRSAPVPGRSGFEGGRDPAAFPVFLEVEHCCCRGREHSGQTDTEKGEVRVKVHLDCMDTSERGLSRVHYHGHG